jgi:hypothetical protein
MGGSLLPGSRLCAFAQVKPAQMVLMTINRTRKGPARFAIGTQATPEAPGNYSRFRLMGTICKEGRGTSPRASGLGSMSGSRGPDLVVAHWIPI